MTQPPIPTTYQKLKSWRARNPEKVKTQNKARADRIKSNPILKERHLFLCRLSNKRCYPKRRDYDLSRDPIKVKARNAVRYLVQVGKIIRQPCEVCGNPKSHAHHADYKKPLEIKWLCAQHHEDLHYGKL